MMTCYKYSSHGSQEFNKWYFNDYKVIKVFGADQRIAFRRIGDNYRRGVTLTKDAFRNMVDVTIVPGMKVQLDRNCLFISHGKRIQLIKYCFTRDKKKCDGGFF